MTFSPNDARLSVFSILVARSRRALHLLADRTSPWDNSTERSRSSPARTLASASRPRRPAGRRKPELDKAVSELNAFDVSLHQAYGSGDASTPSSARAVGIQGDVTNPADLDRLYDQVKSEVGRLDVVFANAGYAAPAPLGSLTAEHIDGLLNTNVKGVIWTIQKALPLMGPGSSIILSASIVASKGFENWSLYSASKAAVRSFARTWSSDLKGRNIRVNAVSPGVIDTPAWSESGLPKEQVDGFLSFAASITPLARTGRDEEVAKVVAFLASDESSFVNGSEVFVDGGIAQV